MAQRNTQILDSVTGGFSVIDMDTGTVLGTNLKIVNTGKLTEEEFEDVLSNDSIAWDIADSEGAHLFVEDEFLED